MNRRELLRSLIAAPLAASVKPEEALLVPSMKRQGVYLLCGGKAQFYPLDVPPRHRIHRITGISPIDS